ncbi:toll/interleukin-1 receptor domain-containing protein [Psychromonas sp. SR45-3]|uniref:toll/interleukin-1 receptor domain-containing protein n=1 Tax=Psychromonas sp. SR45-3 TaxID=2760930 RepID=UPI0015FD0431|nr:toll/interleukin-1 receptor domain-containing protein [Psychromonas sp. SR45-3]MBB1274902.1 toll/interleukin-1 receptor domain-containing protein [Psychromonas sp. SR45-3]
MKNPLLKEIYRLSGVIIPLAATLLSVIILLSQLGNIEYLKYAISIAGAGVGALAVYLYAGIRSAFNAPKVYISYSFQDSKLVDLICSQLDRIQVEILLDKHELTVGDDINKKLNSLVEASDYIIYVNSHNSLDSDWAKKELRNALSLDKKILPVVLDDTPLPDEIKHLMYADFREDPSEGVKSLIKVFSNIKHNKPIKQD